MQNISVNKTGSIEPHKTYCPICGEDADELTIGVLFKAHLSNGQYAYSDKAQMSKANKSIRESNLTKDGNWIHVEEHEKVPASQPCKTCQQVITAGYKIVAEGGIFVHCTECGMQAVAKADSKIAIQIRKTNNIQAPNHVGCKITCADHNPNPNPNH